MLLPDIKKKIKFLTPKLVLSLYRKQKEQKQLRDWEKNGRPVPPPHILKQITIKEYQKKHGYTTFIETGTYLGDMVEAQKRTFKKIISIELDFELYKKAQERFRNNKNITIIQGDSSVFLEIVLRDINNPVIFWLDGHYSSGITAKGQKLCPILEEIDAIFSHARLNHVLLIDDARAFTAGQKDYPSIDELTQYIKNKDNRYTISVENDIIRCVI